MDGSDSMLDEPVAALEAGGSEGDNHEAAGAATVSDDEAADASGEPPFDPAFAPLAPPFLWWQDFLLLALLGAALGAFW